ncbi:exopolysaccharide transport family protein [Rhizobium sp. SSA_523]|uniref:exopolysaccharide transport family protein n=1 Tax=Rhizobium sp. SSA_523 TaxID=2952477 RepID=UPI0020915481|nr:exopolysaccharide transport family protein [Rhizobium sp. SSA_523]MCO5730679.1 exopolysaccharide transport family protein [Rhizobium sp. SSA_523]WKC24493.1 exopolysaccharide transport family protein [Rhizobium sp. SSA_523]
MSGVSSHQDADIDIGQLFAAIWERRTSILTTTAVAAVLAFVGSSLMTPDYKAETRLLIETRDTNLTGSASQDGNEQVLDQYNIVSQAQILQSADLIRQVARDLKLSDLKEFDPDAHALLPDPLVLMGLKQDPMDLPPEDRVIKAFREKLQVFPVEGSRVIAIEMASEDPKLAAAIPNKMAEVYLSTQSGVKLDTHSETTRWLEPEIAGLRERVREAEKKVADYRTTAGLFQSGENTSFSSQQLNDISQELARVRAERANAEARAQNVSAALKAGTGFDTLSDVVSSSVVQRLKDTEANIQAEVSQASISLMEGHPRLKGLRAQLSGIRQQIEAETRKILASLENEAGVARLREQQLMQQLNGVKADSARAGEDEVGLRDLEREAAAQRQLLETYLARYREAASRVDPNSSPADARVVSTAIEPVEPYFPKIIPITIVVALAAFLFYCIGIIVLALFTGRGLRPVESEHDYDRRTDARLAALQEQRRMAPASELDSQPDRERGRAADNPQDDEFAASADRDLAALTPATAPQHEAQDPAEDQQDDRLEIVAGESVALSLEAVRDYLLRRNSPLAIAVSPTGDEGSTATVLLAREIAEAGRTVVLVDMTGSGCPTRLMAESSRLPGITDLLCGTTPFGETIHPDRLSEAHIIPQGNADAEQAMRGADRLTMILDALTGAYDLVLVECGQADARGLGRLTRGEAAELILSMPQADAEGVNEHLQAFEAAGHPEPLVMSAQIDGRPSRSGRYAA